jgi:hypothetical protein
VGENDIIIHECQHIPLVNLLLGWMNFPSLSLKSVGGKDVAFTFSLVCESNTKLLGHLLLGKKKKRVIRVRKSRIVNTTFWPVHEAELSFLKTSCCLTMFPILYVCFHVYVLMIINTKYCAASWPRLELARSSSAHKFLGYCNLNYFVLVPDDKEG